MTCDSNIATIFGSVGGILTVVDILETYEKDESFSPVLHAALCVIRNVSSATSYNYNILESTSVCGTVYNILAKFYSEDVTAGEVALYVVSNLSCDMALSARLAKIDGCFETVVKSLHHYTTMAMYTANLNCGEVEDDGPVEAGIWAVRNLAGGGEDSQLKLCDLGALGMVMNAFDSFPTQQLNVCGAILNLVAENDVGKIEAKSLGLCDKIVNCMSSNVSDPNLCEMTGKIIAHLAKKNRYNTNRLSELKACELAVVAIESHRDQRAVTVACCDILLQLHYTSDAAREVLAQKEGTLSEDHSKPTCGTADAEHSYEDIHAHWIASDPLLSSFSKR